MERLTDQQRMRIAFLANVAMFVTGLIGWRVANSAALLADALDMLADASAYVVAWLALTRSLSFQQHAARWSGTLLVILGVGVLIEAGSRFLYGGEPQGRLMLVFSVLSLFVNSSVLAMLSVYQRSAQVHLRATWLDTRADAIVNVSVFLSGLLIALTNYRPIDWLIGIAIGCYVLREGIEIWQEAGNDDDD
jgi:cation diffusion facilitator family transporter